MDNEMKSYLEQMAMKTKVENYKEFGKTKEETVSAIKDKFALSEEQAIAVVDNFWGTEEISDLSSLERNLRSLIKERNATMAEYEQKIVIVQSAINGMSIEEIARNYSVSVDYVTKILA